MKPLRSWKAWVCLLGILGAATLSGGVVGHRMARRHLEARNDPTTWNEHVTREFERIVRPSAEQGARIQVHLDRAVDELKAIRLDTIARSTQAIWRLIAEVERELTPEQLQAFEAMKPKPSEVTLEVLHLSPDDLGPARPSR
ncbi:MAG: hypothetical protein KF833_09720 [Verrucomicrobiae bacterium]|nr:hypothetical protein [Verrucomicrobiae bacterium]